MLILNVTVDRFKLCNLILLLVLCVKYMYRDMQTSIPLEALQNARLTTNSRSPEDRGSKPEAGDALTDGKEASQFLKMEVHLVSPHMVVRLSPKQERLRGAANSTLQRLNRAFPSLEQHVLSCTCGFGTRSSPVQVLNESGLLSVLFPARISTFAGGIFFLIHMFELQRRGRVVYAFYVQDCCQRGSVVDRCQVHRLARCRHHGRDRVRGRYAGR